MVTSLELQHFAVLSVSYLHKPTSIEISCTTNNPCHLTLYYTDKKPVRHATTRVLRGLALPWGAYWCFVAWKSVEQQEPGDTTTHTFEAPDWAYCQTRWFCFRGTVAGQLSPSVSALLKHHHPGIETILIGSPAIDRPFRAGQRLLQVVMIEGANPATRNGILTQVRVYIQSTVGNPLQTGIFYKTNGNQFTCRTAGVYWTPVVGYNEHAENLVVNIGDYIGLHLFQNLYIDSDHDGFVEYWYILRNDIWLDHTDMNHVSQLVISLEGTVIV